MKTTSGMELLQKITTFRYDNNGNELRRGVEYISLFNKTNPKAYEAAVYDDESTEPIHAVVEQTVSRYDGFNRLVRTELIKATARTVVEYEYDGGDLRVQKTIRRSDKGNTSEVTSYLYDRQHVILETRGNESIRYARGLNYIGRIDSNGTLSYFLFNGHGDVTQTVSEAGEIENQYDYDIFGNPTLTVENYLNSIRYAGEFYDSETGLYYLRARYYDPYVGRFISEDSYWGEDSNPLSLNLYTYAHNDPIQYIDPSGHSAYDTGRQQVEDQVKNESQQGMKDKLDAQKSAYEDAVKRGNKDEADLYKGRMDALNDMMSGSGSSRSGSSSSDRDRSSGNGSSNGSGNRDSNKVTVTWEGYIIDIDISEYNEYKSHGWGIFYGEAYSDKMYNSSELVDTITVASGGKSSIYNYASSEVTIRNYGKIDTINTGEGSHTVIDNYGNVGTINTGIGSTTIINNEGKVTVIQTGDYSHTEIKNGKEEKEGKDRVKSSIGFIYTGKKSENKIDNSGFILSLTTGLNNSTEAKMDGGGIIAFNGGQGKLYINGVLQKGTGKTIEISPEQLAKGDNGWKTWELELQYNIQERMRSQSKNLSMEETNKIILGEVSKLQKKYQLTYQYADLADVSFDKRYETLEPLFEINGKDKTNNEIVKWLTAGLAAVVATEGDSVKGMPKTVNAIPKNRADLHNDLLNKGYRCNGTSEGGYVTYMRDDGMRVDIRPNGEIITTKKEWLPDNSRKITVRYQWDGTPVPNGGHNTGEFVDPIGAGTFLPPKPGK